MEHLVHLFELWLSVAALGAVSAPGYLVRYGLLMLGGWLLLAPVLRELQEWLDHLPPPLLDDPYDLAYVRAGPRGVLRQAFLGLIARQDLIRSADGRYHLNRQANLATMIPEEYAPHAWYLRRPHRAIPFPSRGKPNPSAVLGQLLVARQRRLRQQGLIPNSRRRAWMRLAKYSGCLVILGIGFTHLGVIDTMNGWWRPLFIAELLVATTTFLQMELGFWDYLQGAIDSIDWTP